MNKNDEFLVRVGTLLLTALAFNLLCSIFFSCRILLDACKHRFSYPCPACGETIKIPLKSAKTDGFCPFCEHAFTAPEAPNIASSLLVLPLAILIGFRKAVEPREAPISPIACHCPNCGRALQIPAQYAGTHGTCNHCHAHLTVPKQ